MITFTELNTNPCFEKEKEKKAKGYMNFWGSDTTLFMSPDPYANVRNETPRTHTCCAVHHSSFS